MTRASCIALLFLFFLKKGKREQLIFLFTSLTFTYNCFISRFPINAGVLERNIFRRNKKNETIECATKE